MPVRIPENLPAFKALHREGVYVMGEAIADRQDVRPLRIALLNLMPKKIETETQFARLIGATPLQIELHLIRMSAHVAKNTDKGHIAAFYQPFCDVRTQKYDGMIITGAPVEMLDYTDVTYWNEMKEVLDWTQTNVHSTMAVCWAGMAALHHFHGIKKHKIENKLFGCFRHDNKIRNSPYLRGISDDFWVPVSRWTEIRRADLSENKHLEILIDSVESGPCLIRDKKHHVLYNLNHFEYDGETLKNEYDRDVKSSVPIDMPKNYYPDDDPRQQPKNRWKSVAHLLYGNWINEVYQTTPYDVNLIGIKA